VLGIEPAELVATFCVKALKVAVIA